MILSYKLSEFRGAVETKMTMTLMGPDIILQRPSRTFYNDKKAKAPARALTHQLVLFVFMASSCCRQKIYQS